VQELLPNHILPQKHFMDKFTSNMHGLVFQQEDEHVHTCDNIDAPRAALEKAGLAKLTTFVETW
jgi:hypothetical protein